MRGQLLQCYREGSSEGFRDHLLRGITDPIHPPQPGPEAPPSIRFSCCKSWSGRCARRCSSISRGGRTGVMATTPQAPTGGPGFALPLIMIPMPKRRLAISSAQCSSLRSSTLRMPVSIFPRTAAIRISLYLFSFVHRDFGSCATR